MAFEKVPWIWKERTYFLIWLVTTLVVGWVYIGPLTDREAYDATGWVFALVFPVLVGAMVAVQAANYRQQKACPLNAMGGGAGGTLLGQQLEEMRLRALDLGARGSVYTLKHEKEETL